VGLRDLWKFHAGANDSLAEAWFCVRTTGHGRVEPLADLGVAHRLVTTPNGRMRPAASEQSIRELSQKRIYGKDSTGSAVEAQSQPLSLV
jgi:hypothetical protein